MSCKVLRHLKSRAELLPQHTEETLPLLQRSPQAAAVQANEEPNVARVKPPGPWSWWRRIKVATLVLVCATLVVLLLFLPEKSINQNLVAVDNFESYTIDIDEFYRLNDKGPRDKFLLVQISGALMPEAVTNLSAHKLWVNVRWADQNESRKVGVWLVGTMSPDVFDVFRKEPLSLEHMFDLSNVSLDSTNVSMVLSTDSPWDVVLAVRIQLVPDSVNDGVLYAGLVLLAMYVCIGFELADRTVIAMLSATTSITLLATLNQRPSLDSILQWLDIETLTLLFSMMIMVSVVTETGVFNWLAFRAFRMSRGRVWPLITTLCLLTSLVSAVLDNVTTILLLTPVIIQLSHAAHVDPVRVLIASVIFSNIGGTATAIGDPPNLLIASDPDMQAAGVSFFSMTLHLGLCVLLVWAACFLMLRLILFRDLESGEQQQRQLAVDELEREIAIWRRTAEGMSNMSKEEALVKEIIQLKMIELLDELSDKKQELVFGRRGSKQGGGAPVSLEQQLELDSQIRDPVLLLQSGVVLSLVVLLFFLQNVPTLNLSLGWSALLGALTLLVLTDKADVGGILARVEWATLIFFASLFVLMEALKELGLLLWIGRLVEQLILSVPPAYRLAVSLILILWVSGISSAFVDNIPYTSVMIPVVKRLATNPLLRLPFQPLVWALALGACLGGNGTIIGASANVVCAGVAEQHGYKFTFWQFFRIGFPMTLVSLTVASAYLLICHVALGWNT